MNRYLAAPLPPHESARLERLRSYGVLDTPPEADFDDFTALVSRLLRVPIALISLVDEDRQWFKSKTGLGAESTPRDQAFCAHAILQQDLFVVEDTHADPRFVHNPLVTGDPYIRFYAGCPLLTPDGLALGTLCIIDRVPRRLNADDADTLRRLGLQLMRLLELRRYMALQRETELQLRSRNEEFERLALVAERTHNVVILANPDGAITWVNAAFERVTGYRAEEALGCKPGDLLQFADTSLDARAELGRAVRERRHARVQILNRGKTGNVYWMDVDLQPLHASSGAFVGFVAIETDISDLVRRQQHLDALIEAVPIGLILQDTASRVERINGTAKQLLQGCADGAVPEEFAALARAAVHGPGEVRRELVTLKNCRAESRWMDVRTAPLTDASGQPLGAVVAFSDQTEQIHAGKYIELAAYTADIGYWTWNLNDDVLEFSSGWVERLGLPDSRASTRAIVHPEDQQTCRGAIAQVLSGRQATFKFEERLRTGQGDWRWVLCGGAVTERDASGRVTRLAGIHLDIDEQKRAEAALQRAATTDPLTGLPNRLVMLDRLNRALASAQRHGQCGALLYLDLDHFKRINDSYGHGAGDELLQKVAGRLCALLREEDTLARMGGDEMLVLLPNLGSDLASARLHAHGVGHKLLRALELPIEVDGKSLVVGASVGIALFPKTDGETGEDLVREADTAMYGAKSDTRGTVQFYETAMQQLVTQRLQIDHDLRQALAHDHFDLFIQGKWAPAGGLVGGELLLRWNHPQRGWISPAEFVPIAEESELIVPLGRWVLERACAVAKDLRQTRPDFVLSVNISPKQFRHPEFIDDLQRVVAQAGLSPDALVLEITEGVLLQDQLARHVVALSEAGFRFSLDDFGTGYSSLAYLKRLPVHELKIDRAFVRDIEVDTDDAVLVQAILSIARRFRIQTVAEGVENQAQADFLALHGCDSLQGYHFDRPQPWTAFRDRHLRA